MAFVSLVFSVDRYGYVSQRGMGLGVAGCRTLMTVVVSLRECE
jgi:hypothetical protein|tara:strand:+ start:205 stop:333 length:129 start_codon:yes stop_codon:yes gene_type:complete